MRLTESTRTPAVGLVPYTGYGVLNELLNELEGLKGSATLRANSLKKDEITRAKAQSAADAYGYCQQKLMQLGAGT